MPSRNVIKQDCELSFYHVYARGASKQAVFLDADDYNFFTGLFARYLSERPASNRFRGAYPHYAHALELLAYCLMTNHFHCLVYQTEQGTMTGLMRSLMTSYSKYFNAKYKRSGSLFESRYKAVRIEDDAYLQHISRYIHMNPRYWKRYPHSSLRYYIANTAPEWLRTARIRELFASPEEYIAFMRDYEGHKRMLGQVKAGLAGI